MPSSSHGKMHHETIYMESVFQCNILQEKKSVNLYKMNVPKCSLTGIINVCSGL